jgi:uncharacterized protein
MSLIFWDTNLFIYLLEGHGALYERVVTLRKSMLARGDQLATSSLTLGEVLVKPIELQNPELIAKYEKSIQAASLLIPFDVRAARIYAELRCDRSIRPPDAIQLACASAAGVDLFITNDERLSVKHVEGVHFIASLARAPL